MVPIVVPASPMVVTPVASLAKSQLSVISLENESIVSSVLALGSPTLTSVPN